MFFLPSDKMNVNKFVHTSLPTKAQIFARTGQKAVSPAGNYTGDDPALMNRSKTESAEAFVKSIEDLPDGSESEKD